MKKNSLNFRWLGRLPYLPCWEAMQHFTKTRTEQTLDEIWLLEHPPVLTQGQNGHAEHVLSHTDIPIIETDRGGQVTYHGPGQLMIYLLIDLKRKKMNVREFVTALENTLIAYLNAHNITAIAKRDAPGVYVDNKKNSFHWA